MSAFFQRKIFRLGNLALNGLYAVSSSTMSWSLLDPIGGKGLHRILKLGCDMNTRSSVFCWRVGKFTTCSKLRSIAMLRNVSLTR